MLLPGLGFAGNAEINGQFDGFLLFTDEFLINRTAQAIPGSLIEILNFCQFGIKLRYD